MKKSKRQSAYSSNLYYYGHAKQSALPMKSDVKVKSHKSLKLFSLLILMLAVFGVIHFAALKHAKASDKPPSIGAVTASRRHELTTATASSQALLSSTINNVINQNPNINMSVSLIDLGNGQAANFGDASDFEAASVAKILTAVEFLHQVEAGQESLTEQINGYSARYELQQMIVVSDDSAWQALDSELGYQALSDYAASIGINYNYAENNLTTAETAQLLAKLWDSQILNDRDTQLLLGWLAQANYRDYIVPAVPSDDFVYHKTGLYNDEVNDAAIISNGKQTFVLVIFTNGNGVYNWPARAQMMQTITAAAIKTYL